MKQQLYALAVLLGAAQTQAQTFNAYEHIDINNFNQRVMLHGDMWWNNATSEPQCEYPKGSGKHVLFGGAIWMGGYDDQGQLRVSSQTYRQTGNDYWPGPLDQNGMLSMATSTDWARIWKVNKTTIDSFKAMGIHTTANTHPAILEWPAIHNPYAKGANGALLTITTPMAPFIDKDGDGKYNPLNGDYPSIKGDQMLWWVFSDNGPTHSHSSSQSLVVEIHAAVYGYKKNTLIDNVVYYEFSIKNKSVFDYQDFRMGIWTDADLGDFNDDFIGFDSSRRLGYIYNGATTDGNGAPGHYGTQIPTAGIAIIKSPTDISGNKAPVGSFMYFNNDNSNLGNPTTGVHYYNYLRAQWKDGSHVTHGAVGSGGTVNANYVFPDDPALPTGWSECALNHAPGDRRFVIATDDYEFKKGSTVQCIFAVVATPPATNNGCPNFTTTTIKEVADTAINQFGDPVSVQAVKTASGKLSIYPNPVSDKVSIAIPGSNKTTVVVYNAFGNEVLSAETNGNNKAELSISHLPAGVYNIVAFDGIERQHGKFIKQ